MFANKKRVDVYVALRILPNRIDTHYSTNAMNMYFVESPNMLQILKTNYYSPNRNICEIPDHFIITSNDIHCRRQFILFLF